MFQPFPLRGRTGWRFAAVRWPPGRGPHPAVVVVPGAAGSGRRTVAGEPAAARLARAGVAVFGWLPAGRSPWRRVDLARPGRWDLYGHRDQDDLASLLRHAAAHPRVDPSRVGLVSTSYGLAAAAGCLARHPDLPVAWLVDQEGPDDAASALLLPWRLVEGPGAAWPDRARRLFGHGLPPPGAGEGDPDARFWREREPIRHLPRVRVPYLRLQGALDHVLPPPDEESAADWERPPHWVRNRHAIRLVDAAIEGGVPWVRVNLAACGNPVGARWTPRRPLRWAPGRLPPTAWVDAVLERFGLSG